MSATLRVVLGQEDTLVGATEAEAAVALALGLVATAPLGCMVEAIVPRGAEVSVPGIASVRELTRPARTLPAAWARGSVSGAGRGLIHSATLLAPLVRHDRVHDNDQTVVTVADLSAWDAPQSLPKESVAWQRRMLRRAERFADAIVTPTHSMAQRLGEIARVGDRVRVIAAAAPMDLSIPSDAEARRRAWALPDDYVVVKGQVDRLAATFAAVAHTGLGVAVVDAAEHEHGALLAAAQAAGLAAEPVVLPAALSTRDRAALLAGARALVIASAAARWPWRVVEAITLGIPVVGVTSGVLEDVLADGGLLVAEEQLAEAVEAAVTTDAARLRVLGRDRARAFSWASSAERVWALHADL